MATLRYVPLTEQEIRYAEAVNKLSVYNPVIVRTTAGGAVFVKPEATDAIDLYKNGILTGNKGEEIPVGVLLKLLPNVEFVDERGNATNITTTVPSNVQIPPAPIAGTRTVPLAVQVFLEDVQPGKKDVNLSLNIAGYDPVLVPLRQAMIEVLQQKIKEIIPRYTDPDRFLKTLLNFGDDIQRILINWKLDPNDQTKLLVKLLEPLDSVFEEGQDVFLSREVANTVIDTVKVDIAPIPDTSLWLRPKNEDLLVLRQAGNVLRNKTLSNIGLNVEGHGDEYGNYSFANEILRRWYTDDYRASELNVDYTNYNNFVKYSSAELRLKAFRQKLLRLYQLEQNSRFLGGMATGSVFGTTAYVITSPVIVSAPSGAYPSPTTLVPPSGSLLISTGSTVTIIAAPQIPSASSYLVEGSKKAALEMEQIIRSFDGYERHLFYGSGSVYTASVFWTDSNTEYNIESSWPKRPGGTLYLPTETEAVQWYTTQSAIATRYDQFNAQTLSNTIPSYLLSDDKSEDYVVFTKMVGHFFDNLKLYIEEFPKIYDRSIKATEGLSQDLVWNIAKSFGMDLVNPYAMDDLYNYITDSTSLVKRREMTTELFKRFLHNSLYLNRSKGTRYALRSLLNIFGLNEQIINIRETDSPSTGSFDIFDEVTNVLNFNSGSYLKIPLSASLREIHTVQFRFNTTNKQITTLATGDNLWHARLTTHPSASSRLGRIEITNNIGEVLLSSSYAPVFSGDYYDVMLKYNTSSVNLQIAKSDGDEILYSSSMYTTGSYLRDGLPLTSFMYIGGSGSLSLNNFDGNIDEVRIWGEEISDQTFINQVSNPGSYAGNDYWSAAENLYIRLSFHKPTNVALGTISNDTPYKNIDGISDFTKPLLPDLRSIITYGFTNVTAFPYQMSRITRTIKQYTTNGGASAYGNNKIIIQPPPVFLETEGENVPVLHRTKSIVSTEQRKLQPQSKKFVGFFVSPTDAVNNLIIRTLGNVNIADKVGYPGNQFKESYKDLEILQSFYNTYYNVSVNIPQFVRFFDKISPVLYEQSKRLVPAKTILSTGIVIEPNILERKKVALHKPVNSSGANTKRNLNAGNRLNPRFDITLSTEKTIDIRNDYVVSAETDNNTTTLNLINNISLRNSDANLTFNGLLTASNNDLRGVYLTYTASVENNRIQTNADIKLLTSSIQEINRTITSDYAYYTSSIIKHTLENNLFSNFDLRDSDVDKQSYIRYLMTYGTHSLDSAKQKAITYKPGNIINIGELYGKSNKNIVQSTIIEEIPPRADLNDYGVSNYFNKDNGVYFFERIEKEIIGKNQYNFLTGSAATWSFGTTYELNDVVVQYDTGSNDSIVRNGNGRLYRYVAQNAPSVSYNLPSKDQNKWVPIFYKGLSIQKPYRTVFDVYKVKNLEDLRLAPITIVTLDKPINEPKRYVSDLTIQTLSPYSKLTGAIRLQSISSLFAILSSAGNVRIRLYDRVIKRAADLSRPIETIPTGDHGVLLDITITPDIQGTKYSLFPPVTLVNNDDAISGLVYYTIEEVSGNTISNLGIRFYYFAIETESIVPKGYLPRHYKFFRDTLLSTKRRNYLGCLQTIDTTTDGREPVEVNLSAATAIIVSPNILTNEENLGGTNLNV